MSAHVAQNMYFNKEDERLMRALLSKMKAHADVADEHGAVGTVATERSKLDSIVSKYDMSEADISGESSTRRQRQRQRHERQLNGRGSAICCGGRVRRARQRSL